MINSEKLANLLGRVLAPIKGDRIVGIVRKNGRPVMGERDSTTAINGLLAALEEKPDREVETLEFGNVLRLRVMVGVTCFDLKFSNWR